MKTLTKLLCTLLCIAMLFSMVACNSAEKETDTSKNSDTEATKPTEKPTEQATQAPNNDENQDENNDENKDAPEEEKITSVYEMTLFCGDYGSYAINNYNSDGVLLSNEIHSEDVYFFSVMIFDHKYDESGIIDKTVVYRENDYYYSNSTDRLEEIATIEWTTDDSGKILSGTTGRHYDIPAFYDFTYHANGKLAKVELRDMGMRKNELAFSVEYDENGTKIRETFDGDVEATFKYTDGLITEMTETSLHDENDVAISKASYDELGRITEIKYTDHEEYTYNISFVDNTNIPSVMGYSWKDLEDVDSSETQTVTVSYNELGYVTRLSAVFIEDGEEYDEEMNITYNEKGKIVKIVEVETDMTERDGWEDVHTYEYNAKDQVIKKERIEYKFTLDSEEKTLTGGRTQTYAYDENGNCTEYTDMDTDADGEVTYKSVYKNEYNEYGNSIKDEAFHYSDGKTLSNRALYLTEYNDKGQVISTTRYSFDVDFQLTDYKNVRIYEYDKNGICQKYTDSQYSGNELIHTETYVYNENGDAVRVDQDEK